MRTDGRKAAGKSTAYQDAVTANVECSQDDDAVGLEDGKEDFNDNDINVSVIHKICIMALLPKQLLMVSPSFEKL